MRHFVRSRPPGCSDRTNPAFVLPDGFKGIGHLFAAIAKGGVPTKTLESSVSGGVRSTGAAPVSRVILRRRRRPVRPTSASSVWRRGASRRTSTRPSVPALALTDALTRIADRSDDPVPDKLWREVVKHFDEQQVSALILQIATLNLFNRVNIAVKERADRPSWKQAA